MIASAGDPETMHSAGGMSREREIELIEAWRARSQAGHLVRHVGHEPPFGGAP